MNLSHFAVAIILVIASALGFAEENSETHPNIILIVSDYMGYSDIGPYGATDIQTPSLDELASGGVRFSNHYAAAPVCKPSRAAILSGQYHNQIMAMDRQGSKEIGLPSKHSVLAPALKQAGYKTGLIGKWHLGSGPEFTPVAHGFDSFFGFHSWTLGYHDHLTSDGEPGLYRNDTLVTEEGYLTDLFSEEAIEFIDSSQDQPFFLYLSYNTGLPPYQPKDLDKSQWNEGWDANTASRTDYVSMVETMDAGIGRVLDQLASRELADNTLVIFTYDHGGRHLVNHGPLFHGFSTLWEGGIRVPLIMRWPGQFDGGEQIDTPTIAMDLTATMIDAANQSNETKTLDGQSLILPTGETTTETQRTLFWKFGTMKAARRGNWKYLIDGHTQLLFDLSEDISERKNLFSTNIAIANELKQELFEWEQSL